MTGAAQAAISQTEAVPSILTTVLFLKLDFSPRLAAPRRALLERGEGVESAAVGSQCLSSLWLLPVKPIRPGGGREIWESLQGKATGEAPRAWDPASFPHIHARSQAGACTPESLTIRDEDTAV